MKASPATVIGTFLATVHLALFLLFSVGMNTGFQDAMSGMLWGVWRTVDFPVSLLAFYGFVTMPMGGDFADYAKFIYPYLVHSVIGTMWWFLIPALIGGAFRRLSGKP